MLLVDPLTAPLAYTRRGRRSFLERQNPARCSKKANDSGAKRLHPSRIFERGGDRLGDHLELLDVDHERRRQRRAPAANGLTSTPSARASLATSAAACARSGNAPASSSTAAEQARAAAHLATPGWSSSGASASCSGPRAPAALEQALAARACRGSPAPPRSSPVAGVGRRRGGGSGRGRVQNGSATRAGDDHAAQRQVAAGHALGEDDHVGHDVQALDAEPGAQPAEAADHRSRRRTGRRARAQTLGDALDVAAARRVARRPRRSPAPRRTRRRARRRSRSISARSASTESCATTEVVARSSGPNPTRLAWMPPSDVPKPWVPW